jgi:hypothetical protein
MVAKKMSGNAAAVLIASGSNTAAVIEKVSTLAK